MKQLLLSSIFLFWSCFLFGQISDTTNLLPSIDTNMFHKKLLLLHTNQTVSNNIISVNINKSKYPTRFPN